MSDHPSVLTLVHSLPFRYYLYHPLCCILGPHSPSTVFFQFKILSLNFLRVTATSGDFYGNDDICPLFTVPMREQRTISLRQSADSIDDSRIFLLFLSCSTGDHNPAACASSRGKLRGTVIRSAQPEIDIPDARHYAPGTNVPSLYSHCFSF